ncbi:M28 family peptidase [Exilibacterium tricleocarpae]|nr:M20/M25/M40 family metallo-hydrolase [Exilibacterium tricleocarpae]
MKAHITFLADDALEGRKPGEKGYKIAARYVASQFSALGLAPVGDNSSFYQHVPLSRAGLTAAKPSIRINGQRLDGDNEDIMIGPSVTAAHEIVEGEAVFVGYGIDAPQHGLNDYAGLDLRGKVAVFLNGFPGDLPGATGAHLALQKTAAARRRGAVATIELETSASLKRRPWRLIKETFSRPITTWVNEQGEASPAPSANRATARLTGSASEMLFEKAQKSFASILAEADQLGGKPRGFPLGAAVRIERTSAMRTLTSENIVAMLPGSDVRLSKESVLLTAHLDHIGVMEQRTDDPIYNGAMDNAAGIAALIEIARLLAEAPTPPKRSVVFAALTAEEDGMVGSHYLANHPIRPDGERIVAVLNFDMPILLFDFTDIIALGAAHSTLELAVNRAAAQMRLRHVPDPSPAEGHFTRSDHYRFVEKGVPALSIRTAEKTRGSPISATFLREHYHQPSDDPGLPFNWVAAARYAQISALITQMVADADVSPRWYADSPFGQAFAPNSEKSNPQN